MVLAILSTANLWCDGSGYPPHYIDPIFEDRFRNIPAVSEEIPGSTSMIYCTSFGLKPYRIGVDNLEYTDALVFRSTINNSNLGWSFNNDFVRVDFDDQFPNTNLPDCRLIAYIDGDLTPMETHFGQEEAVARFYGGTGSWASPVLFEYDSVEYLLVLNKSGVLLCLDAGFDDNDCVVWALDLRETERDLHPEDHYKYEFMATPTVVGNSVYVAGIFNICKIDFDDPQNPIYYQITDTGNDHLVAPISFDLNEEPNIICTSYKGKLSILSYDLNQELESENLDENITITVKPLVDADGQVYVAADNGEIYYFSQENINTNDFCVHSFTCNEYKFVSTLITDGTKNIYAFTKSNDILKLEETYDFSNLPQEPLSNQWNNDYLFEHIDENFRKINNHSVLFERYNENTSCLLSIYNDGLNDFATDEIYYDNFDPQNYNIILRFNNTLNDIVGTRYKTCPETATFGGIAPYITSVGQINAIWLDENGYAWSWDEHAPTHLIDYSIDYVDPLISQNGNPKFMKNLTNVTKYNLSDLTITIHDQEPDNWDFFLNSYNDYDIEDTGNDFTVTFSDLLIHPDYTLGIIPDEGDPIVFENIDMSVEEYHYYDEITITGENTVWNGNNSNLLYCSVSIDPGADLTINGMSVNLIDLTLYNESTLTVAENSELSIQGTLFSDDYDGNTGPGLIMNDTPNPININTINVNAGGNLEIDQSDTGSYQISDFIINSGGTSVLECSLSIPISIYEEMDISGTFLANTSSITFYPGSICTIDGEDADFIVNSGAVNVNESELYVINGGSFKLQTIILGSFLNLSNSSLVSIDDSQSLGSNMFLDWGSFITGCTPTTYEDPPPGYPAGGEQAIPGDRIIAQNGGMITTGDNQAPGDEITISSNSEDMWDGIFIENPSDEAEYWFVNCDISGIHRLSIENVGLGARNIANLKLYYTDFQDAGQVIARDGHNLYIYGEEGNLCYFRNNSFNPISAYESPVDLDYVQVEENYSGIYLYDSSTQLSNIKNCYFLNNSDDGVKLNAVAFYDFYNNEIEDNSGFGMLCYDGTLFDYDEFYDISIIDNGFAEYVGWQSTFQMANPNANITIEDTNYGSGSDYYLLMNVKWDEINPVDICGTNITSVDHLFPTDSGAWTFSGEITGSEELLNDAAIDFANQDYESAQQTLHQLLSEYLYSKEAVTAVYYLYHIENLSTEDFAGLRDYLLALNVDEETHIYDTINKVSAKTLMKEKDYVAAIDLLETIIINSELPDEVISAMIDEGYCYLKLSESGDRALPINCTVKTATFEEYQARVREIGKAIHFLSGRKESRYFSCFQ